MQIFTTNENTKHERLLGFQYGCTFMLLFEQMLANRPLWEIKDTISRAVSHCPWSLSTLARVESSSLAPREQGFIFLLGGSYLLYMLLSIFIFLLPLSNSTFFSNSHALASGWGWGVLQGCQSLVRKNKGDPKCCLLRVQLALREGKRHAW